MENQELQSVTQAVDSSFHNNKQVRIKMVKW
ncbi:Protein of unknown function [Bacillus mycoides]|uniref:Uncharacterized protein n=1 Tax=Bacillus mycoides TaxID=1405 RepID=A0A1G4ESJ5_BACMY|nr:hypothetical protein ACOSJ1_EBGNOMHC_05299 [Bacillus mycoides KBAB4]SCB69126.1 Protein of unknown function [Bacillus mycoides]